jgi:FkbM family methyltransferase
MSGLKSVLKKISSRAKHWVITKMEPHLTEEDRLQLQSNSTFFSLKRLQKNGFQPLHIIDIGAHNGAWSVEVFKIFPHAKFIAIEPLPEKKPILEKAFKNMPAKIYNVLLGEASKKNIQFYTAETGSSVLKELTKFSNNTSNIYLDMYTLDEIILQERINGNILLKVDVQGFETEILKGATQTLSNVDVICIEVSFLNYNEGAPLAHDMIPFMKKLGFLIYDVTGFIRKSNDYALIQTDMIFIKEDHPLRKKINNLKEDFHVLY